MKGHKSERRYGDTTECSHCGKQWDTNDPEPPPCKQSEDWVREIREKLQRKKSPE